jgi:DHA1 family tetracycline resistance protein-like MFS transporter
VQKRNLLIVFMIVFVDMLGIGLIVPVLPKYVEMFGADERAYGWLVGLYPLMQFFSTPILGRLSDIHGRRPILLISIGGTIAAWLTLGFTNVLWLIFAARIWDGLTGGNISIAQACITDVTDEKGRSRGLGLIGAAVGLGFIFGPAIGGFLGEMGMRVPAFTAAGFSILNWIGIFIFLPETAFLNGLKKGDASRKGVFAIASFGSAFIRPKVGPLLISRVIYYFPFAIFEGVFMYYLYMKFGLSEARAGMMLAYVGFLIALVQGAAIGRLSDRFGETKLIKWGYVVMGLSLLGWGLAQTVSVLMLILAPLALSLGVLNTAIRSQLSKVVNRDEVGETLGLAASLDGLNRAVGPIAGGYILGLMGTWAPGVVGAVIIGLFIPYVLYKIKPIVKVNL